MRHGASATGARLVLLLWLACGGSVALADSCPPGEPIQWIADYCMLTLETDDEIAASSCIAQQDRRRFASACENKRHYKRRMCEILVKGGSHRSVLACTQDPAVKGRTVKHGGVGG